MWFPVATVFGGSSASLGVPIDLTDSTPQVTGATTLHIDGISTLGSSYWADFQWNDKTNKFDVSAYGEEEGPPEGFVSIEAGTYTMGSPEAELGHEGNEKQHGVTLPREFYLAETEITQAQWVSVMGSNPSQFSGCEDCPVEMVSWNNAVAYCNARSVMEGLDPAYEINGNGVIWNPAANGYRLPTESEWEYACRAGSSTAYHSGINRETECTLDSNLDQIAWYCGNNNPPDTKEVGQKLPNAWGAYDMSGNVYEWCWDWFDDYPDGPVVDPTGPSGPSRYGARRVARGGSWNGRAQGCRSANRIDLVADYRDEDVGLRIARWAP